MGSGKWDVAGTRQTAWSLHTCRGTYLIPGDVLECTVLPVQQHLGTASQEMCAHNFNCLLAVAQFDRSCDRLVPWAIRNQ